MWEDEEHGRWAMRNEMRPGSDTPFMAWKTFGSPQLTSWSSNGVCVGPRRTLLAQ